MTKTVRDARILELAREGQAQKHLSLRGHCGHGTGTLEECEQADCRLVSRAATRRPKNPCPGVGRVAEKLAVGVACPVCGLRTIPFRNGRVRPHNDLRIESGRHVSAALPPAEEPQP